MLYFDRFDICPLSDLLAQCLYVLSDDNTPTVEALSSDTVYISNLFSIAQSPDTEVVFGSTGSIEQVHSLKVLACGSFDFFLVAQVVHTLDCSFRLILLLLYGFPLPGILKNVSPLPKSSPAADIDLDRTVILPLFVPLLGLDLITASNAVYAIVSKPVRIVPYLILSFRVSPVSLIS